MARQSREATQDAALVAFLRALPEQRLEGILEALGVVTEHVAPRADPRRCLHCGKGYVAHQKIVELGDPHAWHPHPPSRAEA